MSTSTVQRAFVLLRAWGVVQGEAGERPRVAAVYLTSPSELPVVDVVEKSVDAPRPPGPTLVNLEVRRTGQTVARLTTQADPGDITDLRRLLLDAVRRHDGTDSDVGYYEMDVRDTAGVLLCTVVA